MSLSELDWPILNREGFFPGPTETEKIFYARVAETHKLLTNQTLRQNIPAEFNKFSKPTQNSLKITLELFGVAPSWAAIVYDNFKLAPWHGAVTWLFTDDNSNIYLPLIQLKAKMKTKSRYLIYHRDEIIAHELLHASRACLKSHRFEELIAYKSSKNKFRRWFGALFSHEIEAKLFVISTLISAIATLFSAFFLFLPLIMILLLALRLSSSHIKYFRARRKLEQILVNPRFADHVIFRLTDDEINQFAQLKVNHINQYINKMRSSSFRWQFLLSIYKLKGS